MPTGQNLKLKNLNRVRAFLLLFLRRVPPLVVSALSSPWTGLAEALTRTSSFVICGEGVPPQQASLASREERELIEVCENAGPSPNDPFSPWCVRTPWTERQPFHEGPSVIDGGSHRPDVGWLTYLHGWRFVIGDRRYFTYPVLHIFFSHVKKSEPSSRKGERKISCNPESRR